MFSYAVDFGIIDHNRLIRFGMLKEQRKEFYALSQDEVARIISEQCSLLHANFIQLIAETGLRLSETTELQWSNISISERVLTVAASKNYGTRKIPLSDPAISSLTSTLRYIGNQWVWVNGPKSRLKYPRKAFRSSVKRAGLPTIGFPDLRRYRATWWYRHRLEVRSISALLDHSDVQTTMRYLGISRDLFGRVIEAQEAEQKSQSYCSTGNNQTAENR